MAELCPEHLEALNAADEDHSKICTIQAQRDLKHSRLGSGLQYLYILSQDQHIVFQVSWRISIC